jgi:hypothetical protein
MKNTQKPKIVKCNKCFPFANEIVSILRIIKDLNELANRENI